MNKNWRDYLKDFCVLSIPTKTDFRGINTREITLFRGSHGWSEFSPFIEYENSEALHWFRASVEAAYTPWPEFKNDLIPINATLPRIAPELVKSFLKNFEGSSTIKIKINSFEEDKELFLAAHYALPEAKIRLDINGMWDLKTAINQIKQFITISDGCIEYIEQPVASKDDLKELKNSLDVEIAADESIRKNLDEDLSEIKNYADRAIIKWQPSGGIKEATRIIQQIGLPVTVSSALESSVGISHGLALAASIGDGKTAAGLGTVSLLKQDVICEPLIVKNGYLQAKRVEVDSDKVSQLSATPSRIKWWNERISNIWNLIDQEKVEEWGWDFL